VQVHLTSDHSRSAHSAAGELAEKVPLFVKGKRASRRTHAGGKVGHGQGLSGSDLGRAYREHGDGRSVDTLAL
jgi:hypothetical protein